ncbi:MAG TPA: acyltransferase family protein, partial [Acidimicrobiales bacterium]|nr:acyltransferase family protein [Acidimicrobiales bacterium]
TNWWFIFHHVSYFERFGPPPLLVHLWSLAIEEQYYLIWPPLLVVLLRRRRPARIALLALAGAAASALLMALLYHGAGSLDRVYYGSDTHAEGLLFGSALALVAPPTGFPASVDARARRVLDRAGGVALAVLIACMVLLGQSTALTWRGGLALAVVTSGVLVIVAAHAATVWSRWLTVPPLRWLGTRSYSIYVWHWPVIVLVERGGALPLAGPAGLAVRLVLIGLLSEGSYRYVERPWRTGAAQAWVGDLLARSRQIRWGALSTAGTAVAGLVALVVLVTPPPLPEASIGTATAASHVRLAPAPQPSSYDPVRTAQLPRPAPAHAAAPAPTTTTTTTVPLTAAAPGGPVLAIGDSVMLAAAPSLDQVFGHGITVDAVVGRQVSAGLSRLAQYRAAGRLHGLRALVIGLGSNGPFTPADFSQLRSLAAGVPLVVMINVRVPDSWESESDATIDAAGRLPGYTVVNWYSASATPGVLWPDGVHPDPAGQALYAHLVEQAIQQHS